MTITVAILFGGNSSEHTESIRAARILYDHAIKSKLDSKYNFEYFYLSRSNRWAGPRQSFHVLLNNESEECHGFDRMIELARVDVIYSTMMGTCGENGNAAGLADLFGVHIIGCGILASSLALDKRLSKALADRVDIPIVDCLYVDRFEDGHELVDRVEDKIGFPCFVKPFNLGTCAFVFRANNRSEFIKKWDNTTRKNKRSGTYLIEKFIPNIEVRVFIHQDINGKICTNDQYVTELKEKALEVGGGLFDHLNNDFPEEIRNQIARYAVRIFKYFEMKDYARIDFFVDRNTHEIYFNEANTQPFLSTYNVKLMQRDGISYSEFLDTMIRRNLK